MDKDLADLSKKVDGILTYLDNLEASKKVVYKAISDAKDAADKVNTSLSKNIDGIMTYLDNLESSKKVVYKPISDAQDDADTANADIKAIKAQLKDLAKALAKR